MRSFPTVLLLAFVVLPAAGPAGPARGSPAAATQALSRASGGDAAEIERLERQLVAAIVATDLATYDRIVADDYVVVRVDGSETTKQQVMEQYRSGALHYVALQISEVKVHVYGAAAVLSARTSGSRREGGQEVPNLVRYVRVWSKRNGQWRAVAQMSQPLPAR